MTEARKAGIEWRSCAHAGRGEAQVRAEARAEARAEVRAALAPARARAPAPRYVGVYASIVMDEKGGLGRACR